MKNLIAGIAIVLGTAQANAGSLNFECDAVNIDKKGEVTKLRLANLEGTLVYEYNEEKLEMVSVGTMEEEQIYKVDKHILKVNVKINQPLKSVQGNYGAREFSVDSYLVTINVQSGKEKANFEGICVEKLVTTCGGNCDL